MTGAEQVAVWLFGIFCAAVSVTSVARAWSTARVETAKAQAGAEVDVAKAHARGHVDGYRAVAEVQHGPHFVPPAWTTDGDV